jgi:hypothetical protein
MGRYRYNPFTGEMDYSEVSTDELSGVTSAFAASEVEYYASPSYYKRVITFKYIADESILSQLLLEYTTTETSNNISIRVHIFPDDDGVYEILSPQQLTTHEYEPSDSVVKRAYTAEKEIQTATFDLIKPSIDCTIEVQVQSDIDITFKNIIAK